MLLHTSCLGVSAQTCSNSGSHEGAPVAGEALVFTLHVVVAEAAHARIHCIPACVAILHTHACQPIHPNWVPTASDAIINHDSSLIVCIDNT